MRLENFGFGGVLSWFYSVLAENNPVMVDFYENVANEVFLNLSSGNILDVGTGPGILAFKVADKNDKFRVFGVDISSSMVEIAKNKAKKKGLSDRVTFQFGDVLNLPFEDESFDLVLSTFSFHHWSSPSKGIKEIYRVLKSGSQAWIYDGKRGLPNKQTRKSIVEKYGMILGTLFMFVSSVHFFSLDEIKSILSLDEIRGIKCILEDDGIFIKIRIVK